ncbi:oligosaccharide flippase family protein [Pseudarthrobacter oxydans]|uniref:lipopolysaccharide biosynthesis protein n=1 Tax=Pseudarthrobacter oxydans TaxID=1671 RepID=UPI003ECF4013
MGVAGATRSRPVAVPPAPRSLLRNVRSALSGNVVYALCQFGMLSVLALMTTPTEVGRYALALAITAPVFLFASLKLRQVQVTDAANEFSFGEYFAQRLLTTIAALLSVIGLVIFVGMEARTAATVAAVALFKAFEAMIDILYGAMQRREQLQLVARSQIWRGLGGFAAFAGTLWLTWRVEVAACGLAIYTLCQVVVILWRVRQIGVDVLPRFSRITSMKLTRLALPLGIAVSVSSLSVNVPRYFIQASQSTAELGIFAALAYLLTITGMVMASLGEAASPRLANLYFERDYRRFRTVLFRLVVMGAGLGVIGAAAAAVLGNPVLALIFGPEYAARNDVLVVLMAAAAITNTTAFLGTAANAMRRFRVQLPINAAALVTGASVAFFAVPAFGIMGGAVAIAAGEVVSVILYLVVVFRVILPATSRQPRHRAL